MRVFALVSLLALLAAPVAHASLVTGDIVVVDQGNAVFRVAPITGDRTVISSNSVRSTGAVVSSRASDESASAHFIVGPESFKLRSIQQQNHDISGAVGCRFFWGAWLA